MSNYCAALNPGGTPSTCAVQQPSGYVVDDNTGKCIAASSTPSTKSTGSCSVDAECKCVVVLVCCKVHRRMTNNDFYFFQIFSSFIIRYIGFMQR